MTYQRDVSAQRSLTRNGVLRLQRRMEAVLRSEFREGQRRGEQLHVGSRHEIFVRILLVKSLTALGVRNEQSPLSFACGRGGEQSIRAHSEFCGGLLGSPALFLCAATRRLCFCLRLRAKEWRANSANPHDSRHRYYRQSLQDSLDVHLSLAANPPRKSIVERQHIPSLRRPT